jgi:uncharacterized protein
MSWWNTLLTHAPLLGISAFAAGALNAVAGGGSFLTFPALVYTGVPPIVANATSALAVSPGYLGATWGFRQELTRLPQRGLRQEAMVAAAGGVVGALLLLMTPDKVFAAAVPWLLLFATVLFALGPRLAALRVQSSSPSTYSARMAGLALVSVYGGYFNGGLGILLLALYTLFGEQRLHVATALKNLHSLVLSWLSVLAFVVAGAVAWPQGIWMMVCATAGGVMGARWAKRVPTHWLRAGIIATGLLMSVVFFWRLP